jgi:ABC-2 type transport system permease protein
MKAYRSIFRIRFIHSVQYRVVVFSLLFTGFLWGLMLVLAYLAFYRTNPAAFPMTLPETVSYMWLHEVLLMLFSVVFTDSEIETSVESGAIAYELVRPAGLYGRWYTRLCAARLAHTAYKLPMLLILFWLPEPYGLMLPPDLFQFTMFLLSTALALCVTVSFTMLMYTALFRTISFGGVYVMVIAATSFLTGSVVPYPFLPPAVRMVFEALPFAAMQNMPLRIYSGNIAGMDAVNGVVFQVVWLIILVTLGRVLLNRSLRKVIVQGG